MPRPPGEPDEFDKVNFVIDAWAEPCEAPWYIYIQLLKPAALTAFITLISFGLGDVARGFARPHGLDRRRSGKRKGKWARRIPKFPEIGNLIGAQIEGSSAVKGANWGVAGRFLWRVDTVLQAGLFWWLIADVTTDFAYTFTSLLYETRWCEGQDKGRFSWAKGVTEQLLPNVWGEIGFNDKDYDRPFPGWVVTFGNSGPKGATVGFGLDFEPFFPASPPTAYQSQVVNIDTGRVIADTGQQPADASGNAQAACIARVPPGVRFGVRALAVDGRGKVVGGAITGVEA